MIGKSWVEVLRRDLRNAWNDGEYESLSGISKGVLQSQLKMDGVKTCDEGEYVG